jgi:4'-phosphopantetheinyl transferase EntD
MAKAVDKRRREFATARGCAREALAELGVAPAPLLRGERGEPQWPEGVVGSLTHCDGYRAAAVARGADMLTIGIDAEPHDPLPAGVLKRVSLEPERAQLAELAAADESLHADRLLFCCKEAVYKAWFPLARRWLGFDQAAIHIDSADRTFSVRLLVPGPVVEGTELRGFAGRWRVSNGLVVTAIAHPAQHTLARAPASG